jgi:hypothetical protein
MLRKLLIISNRSRKLQKSFFMKYLRRFIQGRNFPRQQLKAFKASNFATITHHEIRAAAEALNPSFQTCYMKSWDCSKSNRQNSCKQGPCKYLLSDIVFRVY